MLRLVRYFPWFEPLKTVFRLNDLIYFVAGYANTNNAKEVLG